MTLKRMPDSHTYGIFKRSSKTFFNSSLLFPPQVRDDVFTLYAFLRIGDDFVDSMPQQEKSYYAYKRDYYKARRGEAISNHVITQFAELSKRYEFPEEWIEAFFVAMEMDLTKKTYNSLDELLTFTYGAAEVVGLFMCRILGLPESMHASAEMLGRVVQMINILRSIPEDLSLGRVYFPKGELHKFKLRSLEYAYVQEHPEQFKAFIEFQAQRIMGWYQEAKRAFPAIPWRLRWPVKTSSDLYILTLRKIRKNPFVIYTHNLKPTAPQIYLRAASNFLMLEKCILTKHIIKFD